MKGLIRIKDKRAAMEMSVGTIVTIVLLISVLVLGLVLIRRIMCSGISMTDEIDRGLRNEIISIFSVDDYGIKCLGEAGQEVKLGDGGRRQVFCVIKSKTQAEYNLKLKSIESLKGVSTANVERWVIDQDWSGFVSPGDSTPVVAVLDVPDEVSDTSLKIEIEEENLDTAIKKTHTLYIDVVHVGAFSTAVC